MGAASPATSSSFTYGTIENAYLYAWVAGAWRGTCWRWTLVLADGTAHPLDFKF